MSLFGRKEKEELARVQEELKRLKAKTDPRVFQTIDLDKQILDAQNRLSSIYGQIQQ